MTYTDLSYLENFFNQDPKNIYLFESVYNTLNYIKTYICSELKKGRTINNKKDLLLGYEEKQVITTMAIKEIAKELLILRADIPHSRLSVSNQSLSRMADKKAPSVTYRQKQFVNAVAFGCDLEDLKEGDYSGAKRLLFVPREKK